MTVRSQVEKRGHLTVSEVLSAILRARFKGLPKPCSNL
jgi:hypothetical protein